MKAGIGITCNDSAHIEDVRYKNIDIKNAANPIYILITDRLRTGEPGVKPGSIKDVKIEDVTITDMKPGRQGPVNPAAITALPGYPIENVTIENLKMVYPGGGTKKDAETVVGYPTDYSPRSLGIRPASGFFVRHVRGLTLKNVSIDWLKPDERPTIVAQDVESRTIEGLKQGTLPADVRTLRLEKVRGITLKNVDGLKDVQGENVQKGER